jgi:hypothetical protein
MSFTLYTDVFGAMNMLGHLFKAASFYVLLVGLSEKPGKPLFTVYLRSCMPAGIPEGAFRAFLLLDARGLVVLSNRDVPSGTPLEEACRKAFEDRRKNGSRRSKMGRMSSAGRSPSTGRTCLLRSGA